MSGARIDRPHELAENNQHFLARAISRLPAERDTDPLVAFIVFTFPTVEVGIAIFVAQEFIDLATVSASLFNIDKRAVVMPRQRVDRPREFFDPEPRGEGKSLVTSISVPAHCSTKIALSSSIGVKVATSRIGSEVVLVSFTRVLP